MSTTTRDEIDQVMWEAQISNFKRLDFHNVIVTVAKRYIAADDLESFYAQRDLVADHRPGDLAEFDRIFAGYLRK